LNHDNNEGPAGDQPKAKADCDEVTGADTAAFASATRPDLVRPCDIRGILHSHSRYGDGAHALASMVDTAREIGLEYLGISDHYRSEAHRDGLDLQEMAAQRAEIEELKARHPGFDILQGVELDLRPDGSLPLGEDDLARFDFVIVAVPENGGYDPATLTDHIVAVVERTRVAILGRPVGDFMMRASNGVLDMERVLKAAAARNTAVEINANPSCPELDWTACRRAQELGVPMAISPDAHRAARLVDYRHGAEMAQEAGICCSSILNTLSAVDLRHYLAEGVRPGS
jgi:DNA polymerase (family 10)